LSAKSGRALLFGPLLFVLAVMLGVWVAGRLDRHAQDAGFGIIETDRILVDLEGAAGSWSPWLDPDWSAQLTQAIAQVPSFAADDPAGVDAVLEALGRFSFVAELCTPRVIWPDGLDVPFRLRRPIACVAYQGRFWSVALEWNPPGDQPGPIGVILPGSSLTPPAFRGAFLPVIGSLSGPLNEVWVRHPALLGALSVADSFWVDLPPAEARRLGRFVIDASQDGAASVENPGVVLELEGGRRVWFGRSPYTAKSGELAVETKWEHVMGAMGYLDAGRDWTLVDVRWDRPDIAFVPTEEK
jgi:hypothetical protein